MTSTISRMVLLSALTALALLIEPIAASEIASPALRPDLLLFPLIVAVLAGPGPLAVAWGGLVGLICDCLAGPSLGPRLAAFSLIAAAGSLILPRSNRLVGILLVSFGCTLAAGSVSLAISLAVDGRTAFPGSAIAHVSGASLTTAFLVTGLWLATWRSVRRSRRQYSGGERTVSIGWQRSAD